MAKFSMLLLVLMFSLKAADVAIPFDSITGPTCVVLDTISNQALPFAPERSKFNVTVTDGLAEIVLTQLYVNSFSSVNSIAYVFPLPHKASVNSMKMFYNDSIYTAKIYERQKAQDIYDSLKSEGKSAALLLQEKPNIFQQQIANIGVGDSAFIEITLTMPLDYVDSIYELTIPTMVAPRYVSSRSSSSPWNPSATVEGTRVEVNVLLQTDFDIEDISSPTHPISVLQAENSREQLDAISLLKSDVVLTQRSNQAVTLVQANSYANSDYIVRFKRANSATEIAMASYYDRSKGEGYFAMNIFPDELLAEDTLRNPREILIMCDISGSQGGWPLERQKEVVNLILDRLSPADRLAVMSFNDGNKWAFSPYEVRQASAINIGIARSFINGLSAGGGTNLYNAVDTYLKTPQESEMSRYFVFLTDGFVSNESAIFDRIENDISEPTIFTYGAGNNLNHYFLETCAEIGNGISTELTESESAEVAVDASWEKLVSPQLDNISLDFGSIAAEDLIVFPSKKLYKGMPITCYGRYKNGGTQTVTVKGYQSGAPVTYTKEAVFANGATPNRMIPKLWAKQRIEQLDLEDGTSETNKQEIIDLSVEYQVLSKYTAFLAANPELATEDNMVDTTYATTDITAVDNIQKGLLIRAFGGRLTLDIPAGVAAQSFAVYDLRGRLLFVYDLSTLSVNQLVWDGNIGGTYLANGSYILMIHTKRGAITTQFNWTR